MKWSPRRVTLPCSQLERLESSLLDDAVKKYWRSAEDLHLMPQRAAPLA